MSLYSGTSRLLPESILQDQLVNDFSTRNTLPSKETVFFRVEFFVGHDAAASIAFHADLPRSNRYCLRRNHERGGFQELGKVTLS